MIALILAAVVASDDPIATPKGGGDEAAKEEAFVDDSAAPPEQKMAFKMFTGTWRCSGKANTELAPDVPTTVTIAFKSDLGRFLSVRIDEQKSKQNPHASSSQEIWGYSSALGGFVMNGADSQGGFYAGSSTGWIGDRFWWTTDSARSGKRVKVKNTFTKKSDKEMVFERAVDATNSGDAMRVTFEGTCKR